MLVKQAVIMTPNKGHDGQDALKAMTQMKLYYTQQEQEQGQPNTTN